MICPECGNAAWYAHRVYHVDVLIDQNRDWIEDDDIYECSEAFGPYVCSDCGFQIERWEEDDE